MQWWQNWKKIMSENICMFKMCSYRIYKPLSLENKMMSDFCLFVLFFVVEGTGRQSNCLPISKCYHSKTSNVKINK